MFKKGDLVRLKSGGPTMTVVNVTGDDVYCQWFDNDRKMRGNHFPAEVLVSAEA